MPYVSPAAPVLVRHDLDLTCEVVVDLVASRAHKDKDELFSEAMGVLETALTQWSMDSRELTDCINVCLVMDVLQDCDSPKLLRLLARHEHLDVVGHCLSMATCGSSCDFWTYEQLKKVLPGISRTVDAVVKLFDPVTQASLQINFTHMLIDCFPHADSGLCAPTIEEDINATSTFDPKYEHRTRLLEWIACFDVFINGGPWTPPKDARLSDCASHISSLGKDDPVVNTFFGTGVFRMLRYSQALKGDAMLQLCKLASYRMGMVKFFFGLNRAVHILKALVYEKKNWSFSDASLVIHRFMALLCSTGADHKGLPELLKHVVKNAPAQTEQCDTVVFCADFMKITHRDSRWCMMIRRMIEMVVTDVPEYENQYNRWMHAMDDWVHRLGRLCEIFWKYEERCAPNEIAGELALQVCRHLCKEMDVQIPRGLKTVLGMERLTFDQKMTIVLKAMAIRIKTEKEERTSNELAETVATDMMHQEAREREEKEAKLARAREQKKQKKKRRSEHLRERARAAEIHRETVRKGKEFEKYYTRSTRADDAILNSITVAEKMIEKGGSEACALKRVNNSVRLHHTNCTSRALECKKMFKDALNKKMNVATIDPEFDHNLDHTFEAKFDADAHSLTLTDCPLTKVKMVDPVLAADGHTYERSAIQKWLRTNDTSPLTGAPLKTKTVTPNLALKDLMSLLDDMDRE